MDEPSDGDSVSQFSHVSSSSSSDDPLLLVRIYVPDLKVQKCLQFHRDDLVWEVKQQVLVTLPKELRDCQNYGLFCPPSNGKAGKFLDEERPISDYPFAGPIGYFELKYKRRVYKMLKIDEKQIKQLHTKSNLRRILDYVSTGNVEKISKILKKGLDPNFQCPETGETPLTTATCLKNPSKVIMILANGGAILDYRTRDGRTALHMAVERNNYEALKTLLDLGASPNYKESKGFTPLYYSVVHNADPQICELLLHDHSMIGVSDLQGWHEVHQAARNGMVQHLEHLLFYGADMNARNASGNTPLHVCAVNDQESCARVLLFRGCDKEAMNFANQTPYQVAVIASNLHFADIIQRHGPSHVVPFREAPRYNPRRRASIAPASSSSMNRTHSDPRLELVLQTGIVLKPPSPSPSNRSLPPFSSASSSCETTSTETSSTTTCTSHCGDDSEDTGSSIVTDSSGVGTSMNSNSGGSYESSPFLDCIVLPGMMVVCVENHVDYNSPGHLKVYQGDILEVTGVTDCGLVEAVTMKGDRGFVPTACIQEVKLRNPDSKSSSHKTRTEGRRELDAKKYNSTPRGVKMYGEPRTVILRKEKKGFGFVLRGAKASPMLEVPPCEDFPSLQYLEDVDKGGVADLAGLKRGDYLLEINGVDVSMVSHEQVVDTIRNSGDLVAMTVMSPQSPAVSSTVDSQNAARNCSTLPRKLCAKQAPLPPKRDPRTTLSVGRARAKSMVAGLAEMEALDRVMADYDSEGRSTKSSSVESLPNKQGPKNSDQQPKVASIRQRPSTQRISAAELEGMFGNQDDDDDDDDRSRTAGSFPSSPVKTPKVYASVAEMKRSKARNKGGTLLKLHNSFNSTPDLYESGDRVTSGEQRINFRSRSHSQENINAMNLKNLRQSWHKNKDVIERRATITKPPPDVPPPPPPPAVGQIVKVDVSKVQGDYASVTVSNVKKDEIMSSFRPGDCAKLYASPESVANVAYKNERTNSTNVKRSNAPNSKSNPPSISSRPSTASNTSSESENSGDSAGAIYSTFKNFRHKSNVGVPADNVSTDSGNSTDKGQIVKEKQPLYAKPILQNKNHPFIPDPDYDVSEEDDTTSSSGVEHPVVRVATWQECKRKTSLSNADAKKVTADNTRAKIVAAVPKDPQQISGSVVADAKTRATEQRAASNVVFVSNVDVDNNVSIKKIDQSAKPDGANNNQANAVTKKEHQATEFQNDLAKKIAERHSKIVHINSDKSADASQDRKIEILDVRPGTMKDIIMERRKEQSNVKALVETSSASSVKQSISVFEKKNDFAAKNKNVEHRKSDGIRIQADKDPNHIKLSQSFPVDLSQEDSNQVQDGANKFECGDDDANSTVSEVCNSTPEIKSNENVDKRLAHTSVHESANEPTGFVRMKAPKSSQRVAEHAQVIRPNQVGAINQSNVPAQETRNYCLQSATLDRRAPGRLARPPVHHTQQMLNRRHINVHSDPKLIPNHCSVRPKSTHEPVRRPDDRCSDIERSIEESLEMIRMQVDSLSTRTPEHEMTQAFLPPPPEFGSTVGGGGGGRHISFEEPLPAAIAPPPEFSDRAQRYQPQQVMAHSLPKTLHFRDLEYQGSHGSIPGRQVCNGQLVGNVAKSNTHHTYSSKLPSSNGPKLKIIQKEFRNKPLQQWSGKDVSDWLESLFMPEYKSNFEDAGITGNRLANLNNDDLSDLGVKRVGHRQNMERSLKRYLMK
ncbi:Uncharacterised protein g1143 [Pycnogonum litorale]